jgi:hypothetical protein
MRQTVSPHERLTATLRFLKTGRSYKHMKYSTTVSSQALVNYTRDVSCHLQSSEGGLSEGKNMNM